MLENNTIEDDVLRSINCEAIEIKKRLKDRLEKLIGVALQQEIISEVDKKHLITLFTFVADFKKGSHTFVGTDLQKLG